MRVDIIRVESSADGTFGVMLLNGLAFCCTLEETWKDNKEESCIPVGVYIANRRMSPARETIVWELKDVPGRTFIQIHSGNTTDDTTGCILVGASYGKLRNSRAVLNSGETFRTLMAATKHDDNLVITVRDVTKKEETSNGIS